MTIFLMTAICAKVAGSTLAPVSNMASGYGPKVIINAAISGTTSKIAGGKFANGTVTGAFIMMFNDLMHKYKEQNNFTQKAKSWLFENIEKFSTYMRGQFLEDSGYNQMVKVGNGVITIYDKFTTGFSKMMINASTAAKIPLYVAGSITAGPLLVAGSEYAVATAVVHPVETIEYIEIVNDIVNPSMPATSREGMLYNMFDNKDKVIDFFK